MVWKVRLEETLVVLKIGNLTLGSCKEFKDDVESGIFPGEEYAPYKMTEEEEVMFEKMLQKDVEERRRQHELAAEKLSQADEYEALNLYGDKGNWEKRRN